tara:strand:- start:206 stop:700 length:495 start_codon:yes stop_codon:yes gene_type:complete
MNLITVACADDTAIVIDLDRISEKCPPVMARFLGLVPGFTTGKTDAQGRATFAKELGIVASDLALVVGFLRCGYVDNIDRLMHMFNMMGGCDALDAWYRDRLDAWEQECRRKRENPLCPEDNGNLTFVFEPHPSHWVHDDIWECCSSIPDSNDYWWRKRRTPTP